MSYRFDAPLHAAGYHFGFRGLGVLGSTIPSAGANGPGYGYPSVDPADLNEELWFPITGTPPAGGFFNEDTSFTYAGASTSFGFRKVRAGVDQGSATATIVTGVTLVSADLALSYAIDPLTLVSADLAISYAIDPLVLVSADLTLSYSILADSVAPGADLSKVSPSRIVVFEGSGSRIVIF